MINKVILVGRLGREPELKHTSSDKAFATMSVATSEFWKDKATGERKETTEWHRVTVWGPAANFAASLETGALVYVEGMLRTRKWTDEKGVEHYSTEIHVSASGNLRALSPRSQPAAAKPAPKSGATPAAKPSMELDDDIPF